MKLIAEVNTKLVDITNEDTIIEELQDYSDGETEAQILINNTDSIKSSLDDHMYDILGKVLDSMIYFSSNSEVTPNSPTPASPTNSVSNAAHAVPKPLKYNCGPEEIYTWISLAYVNPKHQFKVRQIKIHIEQGW